MKITDINQLQKKAKDLRREIITEVYSANSGHPGGSLSIADIMTVLYFNELNVNANEPDNIQRDRFVLSKGHCSPALYAALALKGFFDTEELKSFRNIDSRLQGHPDMKHIPRCRYDNRFVRARIISSKWNGNRT
ncbi:Transketolase 2 [compost metagenome]